MTTETTIAKAEIEKDIKEYRTKRIKEFLIKIEQEKYASIERTAELESRIKYFENMSPFELERAFYSEYR